MPWLGQAVQDRYLLRAMSERELRMAITEPAARAGSRAEESLVQALLSEMRAGPLSGASGDWLPPHPPRSAAHSAIKGSCTRALNALVFYPVLWTKNRAGALGPARASSAHIRLHEDGTRANRTTRAGMEPSRRGAARACRVVRRPLPHPARRRRRFASAEPSRRKPQASRQRKYVER